MKYIVTDEYYNKVIIPEIKKINSTKRRAEFMFKCLYPGEKPLSKQDYNRTRFTHRILSDKLTNLYQIKTESQNESFQKGMRKLDLQKKTYGIFDWEDIENTVFVKDFIENGIINDVKFAKLIGLI